MVISVYNEWIDKIIKEKLDEIQELTDESNHNVLIHYFKNNTATKDFNDLENGVKRFRKIKSGKMKLDDAKELQNIYKTNLNEISKGRPKSEEQKSALENIKLLYKSRKVVIKLFDDYCSVVSEAKCKTKYGEGLKVLSPKQMLQRLPIALEQVKTGNTSENLLNVIRQIINSLYQQRKLLRKYITKLRNQ